MRSVLLIGVNRFGSLLAKKLYEQGHQVMAVDKDEERINRILPYVTDARIGDSTNEEFLRSLGIPDYDVCMVAIGGDFQSSLETTALLKDMGAKYVVSRADREEQARFLRRNGADDVINPDRQIAEWAAIRYGSDHILDYIRLDEDHGIFEVPVPEDWAGRSIGQIDIRKKYQVNIMGLREDGKMRLALTPDTVLKGRGTMLVSGEQNAVRKCFNI